MDQQSTKPPCRPRRRWTQEEDGELLSALQEFPNGNISWGTVAAKIPGRTTKDCRKRWISGLNTSLRKGCWTAKEDEKLRKSVEDFGMDWAKVSANLDGTRSGDQCAKRWREVLDPNIRREAWTEQEDKELIQIYNKMGSSWNKVAAQLEGRTALSCRNRTCRLFVSQNKPKPGTKEAEAIRRASLAEAEIPADNSNRGSASPACVSSGIHMDTKEFDYYFDSTVNGEETNQGLTPQQSLITTGKMRSLTDSELSMPSLSSSYSAFEESLLSVDSWHLDKEATETLVQDSHRKTGYELSTDYNPSSTIAVSTVAPSQLSNPIQYSPSCNSSIGSTTFSVPLQEQSSMSLDSSIQSLPTTAHELLEENNFCFSDLFSQHLEVDDAIERSYGPMSQQGDALPLADSLMHMITQSTYTDNVSCGRDFTRAGKSRLDEAFQATEDAQMDLDDRASPSIMPLEREAYNSFSSERVQPIFSNPFQGSRASTNLTTDLQGSNFYSPTRSSSRRSTCSSLEPLMEPAYDVRALMHLACDPAYVLRSVASEDSKVPRSSSRQGSDFTSQWKPKEERNYSTKSLSPTTTNNQTVALIMSTIAMKIARAASDMAQDVTKSEEEERQLSNDSSNPVALAQLLNQIEPGIIRAEIESALSEKI